MLTALGVTTVLLGIIAIVLLVLISLHLSDLIETVGMMNHTSATSDSDILHLLYTQQGYTVANNRYLDRMLRALQNLSQYITDPTHQSTCTCNQTKGTNIMAKVFLAIRDIAPEDLHIKGLYKTEAEANARLDEFGTGTVIAIDTAKTGDTDSGSRNVTEGKSPAKTTDVVVLH